MTFPHGAQKLLGWFDGNGFEVTTRFFTQQMGLPWLVAFLVIIGESLGSVGLIAGFLTRFTAASFIVIMIGAIATVHWPQGFFMIWFGQQSGEGFEYHLLVIAMSAALVLIGGGKWALDGVIARRLERGGMVTDQSARRAAYCSYGLVLWFDTYQDKQVSDRVGKPRLVKQLAVAPVILQNRRLQHVCLAGQHSSAGKSGRVFSHPHTKDGLASTYQ